MRSYGDAVQTWNPCDGHQWCTTADRRSVGCPSRRNPPAYHHTHHHAHRLPSPGPYKRPRSIRKIRRTDQNKAVSSCGSEDSPAQTRPSETSTRRKECWHHPLTAVRQRATKNITEYPGPPSEKEECTGFKRTTETKKKKKKKVGYHACLTRMRSRVRPSV